MIDVNHNHKLTPAELYGAIRTWADKAHRKLTPANINWIKEQAAKDAAKDGHDGTMNEKEFWVFLN